MAEIQHKNSSSPSLEASGDKAKKASTGPSLTIDNILAKNPLQNQWSMWYYKADRAKTWEENQKEVTTFSTVEDFWSLYNHMEFASKLTVGCDYSLFKSGIMPMWEDPQNKDGGRWLISVEKRFRGVYLDTFWLEIMMCLIGEAFSEFGDIVNGAVVNVRHKGDKISLWLTESEDEEAVRSIGKVIKARLGLGHQISFVVHKEIMYKSSSAVPTKYVI